MKSLLRDPLTHFLLAGALLFVLYGLVRGDARSEGDAIVVVDRDALLQFLQYRMKAFEPSVAAVRFDAMSDEERAKLVDDYVREEVLHREALALELDRDDYIIRRRLVQKVEFIAEGFAEASATPDEAAIQRHFDAHIDDYYVEPFVTFTHVFFEAETRPRDDARALALEKLEELNRNRVPFSGAPEHGERFPYHRNYVERTPEFVRAHFGPEIADALFSLSAEDGVWRGPFNSPYGVHLVMLTKNEAGRRPTLEEIRGRVAEDARIAGIRRETDGAIQSIIDEYEVRIELPETNMGNPPEPQ